MSRIFINKFVLAGSVSIFAYILKRSETAKSFVSPCCKDKNIPLTVLTE